MSNRPDHVYQLTHIGYDKQKEYAIKILSQLDKPSCFISGNHDRFFIKSNGADIVKDICAAIPYAVFLGHDVGTLEIKGSNIMLWHGEDSSSYAVSYRIQKLIEALTVGTKPNVLLCGHTHKQGYFFDRNIHAITGSAMSLQSSWMRSKRLANHSVLWIIKLTFGHDGQVNKCQSTWHPFYL